MCFWEEAKGASASLYTDAGFETPSGLFFIFRKGYYQNKSTVIQSVFADICLLHLIIFDRI